MTALAGAVLLALSSGAAQAQPTNSEIKALKETVEELRKQVQELRKNQSSDAQALEKARTDELRKQLEELRAQLKTQQNARAAADAAAPPAEGESQESIDARTAASKADIQGLRTDLENYKYDQSRLQERNIPSVTRNTKIGGTITVGYATQNPATPPTTASGTTLPAEPRKSGFTPVQAGLNFTGNLFRDYEEGKNLTYRLAFTTATNLGSSASYNTSGQSSNSGTQFNVTDAYLRYSYQPVTGNAEDPIGTLTLGQQTIPFGQDAQAIDPEVKAVIGNAGFVSGLGLGTRQVGLILNADYDPYVDYTNNYRAPLLAYSLGLVNGNGPNKQDNNSLRDWIGRMVFTLPVDYSSWFRQLQIGASYYRGYTALGSTSTYVSSTTGLGLATNNTLYPASKGSSNRLGFDINWTHLPYSISYEWAYGKDELLPTAANLATNPDGFKRGVGQYINFGYTWGEQFLNSSKQQGKFDDYWPKSYQAFVRFDSWDPNRSNLVLNDHVYVTTLGLNMFFAETTKFQINYLHTRNQLGATLPTVIKPASSNGIQAQFNATF
jgi:TolA-binding protein